VPSCVLAVQWYERAITECMCMLCILQHLFVTPSLPSLYYCCCRRSRLLL
jgi:hypothetical protein